MKLWMHMINKAVGPFWTNKPRLCRNIKYKTNSTTLETTQNVKKNLNIFFLYEAMVD